MRSALRWMLPVVVAGVMATALSRLAVAEDMPAGKGTITGTVTKDGQPVPAGTEVRLTKGRPGGPPPTPATQPADKPPGNGAGKDARPTRMAPIATVKTDDKGAFTMNDVPEGSYNVVVGSRNSGGRGMAKVDVKAGETATVTVEIKPMNGPGGAGGPGGPPPGPPPAK